MLDNSNELTPKQAINLLDLINLENIKQAKKHYYKVFNKPMPSKFTNNNLTSEQTNKLYEEVQGSYQDDSWAILPLLDELSTNKELMNSIKIDEKNHQANTPKHAIYKDDLLNGFIEYSDTEIPSITQVNKPVDKENPKKSNVSKVILETINSFQNNFLVPYPKDILIATLLHNQSVNLNASQINYRINNLVKKHYLGKVKVNPKADDYSNFNTKSRIGFSVNYDRNRANF